MNRICIIGASGTGKTVLSDNLAKDLNLPVFHLDGINYFENWKPRDKKERDKIILEKVLLDKWIIDGNYCDTLLERLKRADLIIYLDYSSLVHLKGVVGRYMKNRGKEKKEIKGCHERLNIKFFIWTLKWKKKYKAFTLENLSKVKSDKVLIFKNRRELNKWYKNKFNKKIKVY